ncbi:MAG: universal stress protein, partial [Microcystaceae cyanobacterium]
AADLAGTCSPPAVVHPQRLIYLEDYAFESTPIEAERLIQERRSNLQELIDCLEPPEIRFFVQPIVRVTNDVARETSRIAELDRADLIIVGWHRSSFSSNRLGGRVGSILSQIPVDVAVYVDRGHYSLNRLLVPYAGNPHDDLGLQLALRLLVNNESRHLTVLRVQSEEQNSPELSYEFHAVVDKLPSTVQSRIEMPIIEANNPVKAVVDASTHVDLTIAGTSREWGIERQTLGRYTDALAVQCHSSLLITRCHLKVSSHLSSVLGTGNREQKTEDNQTV